MILAHYPVYDLDLEDFAGLPHQLPHPHRHIAAEDLITVFGNPDKVVLDVVNCVSAVSIIPSSSFLARLGGLLYTLGIAVMKSARLKAGV